MFVRICESVFACTRVCIVFACTCVWIVIACLFACTVLVCYCVCTVYVCMCMFVHRHLHTCTESHTHTHTHAHTHTQVELLHAHIDAIAARPRVSESETRIADGVDADSGDVDGEGEGVHREAYSLEEWRSRLAVGCVTYAHIRAHTRIHPQWTESAFNHSQRKHLMQSNAMVMRVCVRVLCICVFDVSIGILIMCAQVAVWHIRDQAPRVLNCPHHLLPAW